MNLGSIRGLLEDFVDSLVGNFIVTPLDHSSILELNYIKKVDRIEGEYTFSHLFITESEIELSAEVLVYHLTSTNTVEKYELDSITIKIDTTKIIPISKKNINSLLIDNQKLVRVAAEDWYGNYKNRKSSTI